MSMQQEQQDLKLTPFLSLLQKEIMRFAKVFGQTVLTPLINSSLYLLIFGVSLGKSINLSSGINYLAFLIPGLITMSTLNNAFQNSSSSIIGSKYHGDINDLKITPLTLNQIIAAFGIGAVIRGLTVGFVTLLVSELFYYFTYAELLVIAHPVLLIFFLFIGGVAFGLLGIIVGFGAKSFEQVNAIGSFVLLPLIYLGGVFYSLENLHSFWRAISNLNPLLYYVNGVRFSFLGQADVDFSKSLIVSLISVLVLYVFTRMIVRKGSYNRW